jgi:hypothetical protein
MPDPVMHPVPTQNPLAT